MMLLDKINILDEVKYSIPHNQITGYIRVTQNTLSRRLTIYLKNGLIKGHFLYHHNKVITRRELVDNIKIIKQVNNR